jgi:hypothetical protein
MSANFMNSAGRRRALLRPLTPKRKAEIVLAELLFRQSQMVIAKKVWLLSLNKKAKS